MNILWSIFLVVLIVGFLAWIANLFHGLFKALRSAFLYWFKDPINRYLIKRNLQPEYREVIQSAFQYYRLLNYNNQVLFEKRVQKFIDKKSFYAEGGLNVVTSEMKALIAASAVQLTFGHPGVYLISFRHIHVYPDFYFSEGMQQFNAGEVHKSGHVYLSWPDFLEGYTNPFNGRNLGLHEMAHALRLENLMMNEEYGYLNWDDIQKFNEYTVLESNKIKRGEYSLLREYASVHYQEFFAVLIEVFFEQPNKLKEYHLDMFNVTVRLLRQDPIDPNIRIN